MTTLSELKALSDSLADDRKFLAHPTVREIYWGIVEPGRQFGHDWMFDRYNAGRFICIRDGCGAVMDLTDDEYAAVSYGRTMRTMLDELNATYPGCTIPAPVPGSLADATEVLRGIIVDRLEIDANGGCAVPRSLLELKPLSAPRDRFVIFAAMAARMWRELERKARKESEAQPKPNEETKRHVHQNDTHH